MFRLTFPLFLPGSLQVFIQLLEIAGEIFISVLEDRLADLEIFFPLALPRDVRSHILGTCRAFFGLPIEAFENPFVLLQLDYGISIAFDLLEIVQIVKVAVPESSRQHLGFKLVDCGQGAIFFQEEYT